MVASKTRRKRKSTHRLREAPPITGVSDEFFNRELSWLQFNNRVLAQVESPLSPLLERVRFLTIVSSNLDEFFMSRVGGIKRRLELSHAASPWNTALEQQLKEIRSNAIDLLERQDKLLLEDVYPALRDNNIHVLRWIHLTPAEQELASSVFHNSIFPVLTPLAVDPGHPFPFISNLSLSLGVLLGHPERDEEFFARVKVPSVLPQFIKLDSGEFPGQTRGITLADLIRNSLHELFPGMQVKAVLPFRITRNAEIEVDSDDGEDIVELISEELKERKFASIVRLEVAPEPNSAILRCLIEEIGLHEHDVYVSAAATELLPLKELCDLPLPHLKFEPWSPVSPPQLHDDDTNIFTIMRSSEILVHHPYESFTGSVERFLRTAVEDPRVLSIKMTLYRLGDHSALIPLLIRAAEQEKQVAVLIEVKASLDEARNIRHAQMLEDAGVHVVYGVVGLKTHAKVILVARREHDAIRCYAHVGTGNYNSTTARLYTDLGLFTCDKDTCDDLVDLFHYLTGRSLKRDYRRILAAPASMRDSLLASIEQEIELHKKGVPAHIIIKANSLEETSVCRALMKASQAGVPVDLIIRGVCCLKPAVRDGQVAPRVVSVIGRFLEHSRVYYFRSGAEDPIDGSMFISSADPMHRNLHRRVEVATPLLDRLSRERCWELLSAQLNDHTSAWELAPDGSYSQRPPSPEGISLGSQQLLMKIARERASAASQHPALELGHHKPKHHP